MTTAEGELERISARYLRFAADEARGESELYERLALAVAASRELRTFLAGLPADKRQPNLFLAAVRHLCGVPQGEDHLVELVRQEHHRIHIAGYARASDKGDGQSADKVPFDPRMAPPGQKIGQRPHG